MIRKSDVQSLVEGQSVLFRLPSGHTVPAKVHHVYPLIRPRRAGTGRFAADQVAVTICAEGAYFLCNNLIGLDRISFNAATR